MKKYWVIMVDVIHMFFTCYTMMLFIRILGSWFPKFRNHKIMLFIHHYTEPYLGIFRKIIPPIGGVLDLSPLIGFFVLRILEKIVINFVR